MQISDDLDAQINEGIKASELCKADVIRQALRIGLPQFASRFHPAPLWLEERIREALTEPAAATSSRQFDETMAATPPFTAISSPSASKMAALKWQSNLSGQRRR